MSNAAGTTQTPLNPDTIAENTRPSREQPVALSFQTFLRSVFLAGTVILLVLTIISGVHKRSPYLTTLIPFCLSMLGDPYEFAVLISHIVDKKILPRFPMPLVLLYECGMLASTTTGCVLSYRYIEDSADLMAQSKTPVSTTILVHGHPKMEVVHDTPPGAGPLSLLIFLSVVRLAMLIMAMIDTVRWAGVMGENKKIKEEEAGTLPQIFEGAA